MIEKAHDALPFDDARGTVARALSPLHYLVKPKAMLDETAGTTAYRMLLHGGDVLLGRMNRVVQRVNVQ